MYNLNKCLTPYESNKYNRAIASERLFSEYVRAYNTYKKTYSHTSDSGVCDIVFAHRLTLEIISVCMYKLVRLRRLKQGYYNTYHD